MITAERFSKWIDGIILALIVVLLIGTPLLFSNLTRSVFEVNKLLLLRETSLFIYGLWVFKFLVLKDNDMLPEVPEPKKRGLLRYWKSTGFEYAILFWFLSSLTATVFGENIRISIFGAYDRWEGILTIINYIMLVLLFAKLIKTKTAFLTAISAILFSTGISAIYGIFQSLGLDPMNWSADEQFRVFASINNPVHYCPYMAMVFPLGIAFVYYLASKPLQKPIFKSKLFWTQIILFVTTLLIFYAQFLSYSRAAWLGFAFSMPIFFTQLFEHFSTYEKEKPSTLFIDISLYSVTTVATILFYFFELQNRSSITAVIIVSTMLLYPAWGLLRLLKEKKTYLLNRQKAISGYIFGIFAIAILLFPTHLVPLPFLSNNVRSLIFVFVIIGIYFLDPRAKSGIGKIALILMPIKIQFVSISLFEVFQVFLIISLLAACYIDARDQVVSKTIQRLWCLAFILAMAIILLIPSIPNYVSSLKKDRLLVLNNVATRLESIKKDAQSGNARISMWKSAYHWFKDYPMLGSGLDTVKYLYPIYRGPDYGILEGGHNFTPDRVHNEYLNNLITKGIFGFLSYYLGFLLFWYIKSILFWKKQQVGNEFGWALIASVSIYQVQVMFNFGVVATMVLLYTMIGLGISLTTYGYFQKDKNND